MPPHITLKQATNFSLYMLKETLAGHGAELVDMARANVP